jgi:hypothetical protein
MARLKVRFAFGWEVDLAVDSVWTCGSSWMMSSGSSTYCVVIDFVVEERLGCRLNNQDVFETVDSRDSGREDDCELS